MKLTLEEIERGSDLINSMFSFSIVGYEYYYDIAALNRVEKLLRPQLSVIDQLQYLNNTHKMSLDQYFNNIVKCCEIVNKQK
jgi:hypothetical protein